MAIDPGETIITLFVGAIVPTVFWLLDRKKAANQESKSEERERAAEKRALAAEERERKAEERALSAEKEIRDISRRGNAPRFSLSNARFNSLYLNTPDGGVGFLSGGSPVVLSAMNLKVSDNVPAGEVIYLIVENRGEVATLRSISCEGMTIGFGQEAQMNDSHGFQYFYYTYDPALAGHAQKLSISFETRGGHQDTHIYETVHGRRELQRVDPP